MVMRYPLLFLALLLQLAAYLLFCKGFFPTKVLMASDEVELYHTNIPEDFVDPPPKFNKVVLMVVDAMRADFIFSDNSNMSFAHSLLNQGYGVGFTAFSNPPTVTLPRLKGITTGSTPNFIDAVLNIAEGDTSSSLGDQDSWIKQMATSGWKVNMFGDDTWLKLFPTYFTKTDGTASFYVSDFTIVDNNVTRHLDYELSDKGRSEWDCMILHYLGLDHIGHKGGANSLNMPSKQAEMDAIIQRIFDDVVMKDPETLFIVMGDHGMNDIGNHGGSSAGETSPGLLMVSQKFKNLDMNDNVVAPIKWNNDYNYFTKIDQIDLVPTLSELIGMSVPINNLGTFIPNFLKLYGSDKERKDVLIKNALQLKVLLDKSHGKLSQFEDLDLQGYIDYIHDAKDELLKTSSNYNYTDIYGGIISYAVITLVSLIWFGVYFKNNVSIAFFDVVFFILYSVNFIASSMVEEEHHLWWFFTTLYLTYVIYFAIKQQKIKWFSTLFMLIGLRVLKAWNNSGQKHNIKANIKISTYLSQLPAATGPNVYGALLMFTFIPIVSTISLNKNTGIYPNLLQLLTSMMTFLIAASKMLSYLTETFDLANPVHNFPKWCYVFLEFMHTYAQVDDHNKINNIIFNLFQKIWLLTMSIHLFKPTFCKLFKLSSESSNSFITITVSLFTFILISQTNYFNVPIFTALYFILDGFDKIAPVSPNSNILNLFTILMQNLTFFQFGSTNSLSSVDLTNSFNGLTSYNMVFSGLLTYTCNWAGPIFWTLAHLKISLDKIPYDQLQSKKWDILFDRLLFNFVFYSVSGLSLLVCCYHLRFHLFIWTVFSPKILYFLSWLICNMVFDFIVSFMVVALYVY